jgi:hypothetical protein
MRIAFSDYVDEYEWFKANEGMEEDEPDFDKITTTDIDIAKDTYIRFTQSGKGKLEQILIKFKGQVILIDNKDILPFFNLIQRVKEESAKL